MNDISKEENIKVDKRDDTNTYKEYTNDTQAIKKNNSNVNYNNLNKDRDYPNFLDRNTNYNKYW